MEFHVNHPILFIIAGLLVAVVLAQSVFFLLKALRRSKEIGMDQIKIRKTIKTAAIFTIAPAVSIVISVIALSKSLGIPLPWLRLSVVGSMSYETVAASNAMEAMGQSLGSGTARTAQQCVNVLLAGHVHVADEEVIEISAIIACREGVIDLETCKLHHLFLVGRNFFVDNDTFVIVVASNMRESCKSYKKESLHSVFLMLGYTLTMHSLCHSVNVVKNDRDRQKITIKERICILTHPLIFTAAA